MRASHFSKDTRDLFRLLALHEVRFLLVGGEAVIYYGSSRLTGDVDLFFEPSSSNTKKLFAALSEFWGGEIPEIEKSEDLAVPRLIIQFGVPPNRIDLINSISGVTFAQAWAGRLEEKITLEDRDFPLSLIGIEQLIRNKESVSRPKDREDLKFLMSSLAKKKTR